MLLCREKLQTYPAWGMAVGVTRVGDNGTMRIISIESVIILFQEHEWQEDDKRAFTACTAWGHSYRDKQEVIGKDGVLKWNGLDLAPG